jgi:hypothetical protein
LSADEDRGRHVSFQIVGARASFEPHRGETRQTGTSIGSQTETGGQTVRGINGVWKIPNKTATHSSR